jgi:hypothetical protein
MDDLEHKVRLLYSDMYNMLESIQGVEGAFAAGLREGYTDVLVQMINRGLIT